MRDPKRGKVFIGVARTTKPMRQRSTLAHELGHVTFGDWVDSDAGGWSRRSPGEMRADAFARHLLVPVHGLRDFIGGPTRVSLSTLSAVVQRYLVSPALAAIALEQAGYIDEQTKQLWMATTTPKLAVRFGWSAQYNAMQAEANQPRAPQRLLARAIQGYTEGVLSVQAIATLRGTTAQGAEAELRDAGIARKEPAVAWADPVDLPAVDVDLDALDDDLSDGRSDGGTGPHTP